MILKGKTLKGKNRIREHGEVWFIEFEADTVQFDPRPGPWALIFPKGPINMDASRWIHLTDDKDFEVVKE